MAEMPESRVPQESERDVIDRPLMRQIVAALDTAGGCLDLVAEDRKPVDLDECRREVKEAYEALLAIWERVR